MVDEGIYVEMDRYKIAILNNRLSDRNAYHFPETGSIKRVVKNIDYCITHNGILAADNVSMEILDSAVIKICNYYGIPLILETESAARMFSISYSYKHIYSYNTVPTDRYINVGDFRDRYVVCYNSVEKKLPDGLKALVVIYGSEKTEELLLS